MATAELPEDGELRLGAVALPAGRRIILDDDDRAVAWVTGQAVQDPGRVWSALSDMHPQTGLVPVLLDDDPAADAENFFFYDSYDPRGIDALDAAEVLAERWNDPDYEPTPLPPFRARRSNEFLGLRAPDEGANSLEDIFKAIFSVVTDPARNAELERLNQLDREEEVWPPQPPADQPSLEHRPFPGLAPAVRERLTTAELSAALASLAPARICLVPASRPADVLAVTGWIAFDQLDEHPNGVRIGSVLRSWEDRFGARLLKIGPGAEIRLLVERPPRTPDAAEKVANEHWAFAEEFHDQGNMDFPALAGILADIPPVWQFWWD